MALMERWQEEIFELLWELRALGREVKQDMSTLATAIANLQKSQADLTAAVQAGATEISNLATQVKTLTGELDPTQAAAIQAAADAIEAQAQALNTAVAGAVPAPAPVVTPAPEAPAAS
jgi:septal ring factor EnvC (AmiA/AmiB activator)